MISFIAYISVANRNVYAMIKYILHKLSSGSQTGSYDISRKTLVNCRGYKQYNHVPR